MLCVHLADVFVCVRNLVEKGMYYYCYCYCCCFCFCYCLFSEHFSFWYFYVCTKGDPHRSGFKFQTAVLPFYLRCSKCSCLFCSFLRYLYLLDAVYHADFFLCMFRSMTGVLCMIMSASFGFWHVPIIRSSFLLLLSRSGKYVVIFKLVVPCIIIHIK